MVKNGKIQTNQDVNKLIPRVQRGLLPVTAFSYLEDASFVPSNGIDGIAEHSDVI